jgi:hypothetical protein
LFFYNILLRTFKKLLIIPTSHGRESRVVNLNNKGGSLLRNQNNSPAKTFKKMRDLVFKNLTSPDRRKKMISSCEIDRKQGMLTIIRRHFIYKVIEIKGALKEKPISQIYIRRICNRVKKQESFFCRLKGGLYAKSNGRVYLILFGHSLKIDLKPAFMA